MLGDKIKLKENDNIVEKLKSKKNKIYEKTIGLKLVRCQKSLICFVHLMGF